MFTHNSDHKVYQENRYDDDDNGVTLYTRFVIFDPRTRRATISCRVVYQDGSEYQGSIDVIIPDYRGFSTLHIQHLVAFALGNFITTFSGFIPLAAEQTFGAHINIYEEAYFAVFDNGHMTFNSPEFIPDGVKPIL